MTRLTALLALLAIAASSANACYSGCRFRFCSYQVSYRARWPADVPFTGAICDKRGLRVGIVGATGEAHLVRYNWHMNAFVTPISQWRPNGLHQRFSPSFFKSYTIRVPRYRWQNGRRVRYYEYLQRSGVGHEAFRKGQRRFLARKCFLLPIRAWQVLDKNGHVLRNVNSNYNPTYNCIAFHTRLS